MTQYSNQKLSDLAKNYLLMCLESERVMLKTQSTVFEDEKTKKTK